MKSLKVYLFIFVFLFLSCNNTPDKYSIDDFLSSSQLDPMTKYIHSNGYVFSFDNSNIIASINQTGVYNAFSIDINTGKKSSLTKDDENAVYVKTYFPNDNRIIYQSDIGGNELDHVYVLDNDGNIRDLTPGNNLKASFSGWSEDDLYFYIETNERDPRYFDLYRYNVNDYSREIIFNNNNGYNIDAISSNGLYVALTKTNSRYDTDVYIYEIQTGNYISINETEKDVNQVVQYFSSDSKKVYLLTDQESEFQYLVEYNLKTGTIKTINKPDWGIVFAAISPSKNYQIIAVNEDAKRTLYVYDLNINELLSLPEIDNLIVWGAQFSRDDKQMIIYAETGRSPVDIYHLDLGNDNLNRITYNLNENINETDLVKGEIVRYNSFDNIEIPGVLYIPHIATEQNKVPALVWVHGGPGGQSMLGYRDDVQYIVNQGYTVYAINNRGSNGYGKTFQMMDDRKHGKGDLDDCITSKIMLIDTGLIDPDRIGIIGGSYGGYMVLAALAFRPESFKLGVDIFGVANWVRTLQSIPPWWESARKSLEIELGNFNDTDYLTSISPLFHSEKIKKPLLVLQGANDPRVLKIESDEIVSSVRKNNVPVEYIIFDDEGHGFEKIQNKKDGFTAIISFLEKHL